MADYGNFFVAAKNNILSVLDSSLSNQIGGFSNVAYSLGKYGISIYVLWYAYTVVVGKQKSHVQDFIWNLFRFWLILVFVRNMGGWLNSANQAIDGLRDTLSGNVEPWVWLDQLWTKVQQVGSLLMSKDPSTYVKMDGGIGLLLSYIGGGLALIAAALTFLMGEITLKLLATTAPLFILCLMFGFLRQMFNSWLQLIFSSCLIFLFGSLALRAGTSYLNVILSIAVDMASDRNIVQTGATVFVAGVFMAFVIWQAKTYASQLAGVGVEGALQGAAAMGIGAGIFGASRMARGALGMGKNAGIGAWKGIRREEGGLGKSPGLSGKLGNLTGQGINISAKKLRSAAIERAKKKYGG